MKKIYSFLMLMCLAIGSAWAETGLYILGKEVPFATDWSYQASYFNSNATGTISYNSHTGALTFDNVKINETGDKIVIYNKYLDDLDIFFKGECELTSKGKVIRYDVPTNLDGSASTHVRLWSLWDEEAIYSNQSYNDGAATLYIKNFPDLLLWSVGDYCISHKYGKVHFVNSHITMEGDKGTLHTNFYATGWYSGLEMEDCHFGGDYVYDYTGDSEDICTYTSDTNKEKVKKAVILRDSEYTGVRLNGEAILTSDSRWNASQKKFTLNANVSGTSYTYPAGITLDRPGITIDGGGKTASGRKYGLEQTCLSLSSDETTIRNIILTGSYSGIYAYAKANNYSYIRLEDNVGLTAIDYAIYGGKITFAPSGGKTVSLYPLSGVPETSYGGFFREMAVHTKLYINECNIYPAGLTANDTTFVSGTTPWRQQVVITGWQKYDLYVNGTQVNENNKDNLTSLLGDDATGTLKYDPNTQTLTMNNLKANLSSYDTKANLIHTLYGNLTIAVEGDNEIQTSSTKNIYQMWSHGNNFIIKGTGPYASKLTLKGSQQFAFINADKPVIKDVRLNIEGNGTQNGMESKLANAEGTISNANVSIKNTDTPLAGRWSSSGVHGAVSNSGHEISFDPDTKRLVYLDENGPTSNVVTKEDVTIYPSGSYTLTVDGSKPQSYTPADGVCFDEFSNRLYLRNAYLYSKIVANMSLLKIHTIGSSYVTVSDIPISVTADNLIFQGPGSLRLWSTSDNNMAAQIIGRGNDQLAVITTVQIRNTTLNLRGKIGMSFSPSAGSPAGNLYVIGSRVEANCPAGGMALLGFNAMGLTDCTLYTPTGGYYSNPMLHNADGSAATQMIILTEAPDVVELNVFNNNDEVLKENYGKSVSVSIRNLTIKGDGSWRTICLPFELNLEGSVLQGCEVREFTSARLEDNIGVLDFTKEVDKINASFPYIIRNTSGTDIINPNFGVVSIGNLLGIHDWPFKLSNEVTIAGTCNYQTIADASLSNIYVLDGSPVLVPRFYYVTVKGFEPVFQLSMEGAQYYVIDTGHGEVDDLIDGIETVDAEPAGGAVYDLSGRKYDALPNKSGIYIKNGKKVLVK